MRTAAARLHDFTAFLTRSGLKSTHQRARIVEAFFAAGQHISAEELYRRLRADAPSLGLVTVYRTLKLLRQAGLATERKFGDAYARFDPNPPSPTHHHLICTRCGMVQEFEDGGLQAVEKNAARRHGFSVTAHNLELYGLCRGCSAQMSPARQAPARRPVPRWMKD